MKPDLPIPTDNLYKFLAVGGLAAAFVSGWFSVSLINSLTDTPTVRQLLEVAQVPRVEGGEGIEGTARTELHAFFQQAKKDVDHQRSLAWAFQYSAFFSAVVSVVGFVLWYYRVQIHQDIALQTANIRERAEVQLAIIKEERESLRTRIELEKLRLEAAKQQASETESD